METDSRRDGRAHLGRESGAGSQGHREDESCRESRRDCGGDSARGSRTGLPGELRGASGRPGRDWRLRTTTPLLRAGRNRRVGRLGPFADAAVVDRNVFVSQHVLQGHFLSSTGSRHVQSPARSRS